MTTLANLRLLSLMAEEGEFTSLERLSENDNKKATLELERIIKLRIKEKRREEKETKKKEKRKKREDDLRERLLRSEEMRRTERERTYWCGMRGLQIDRERRLGALLRSEENRQEHRRQIFNRFGFPLILNGEQELILYTLREDAMEEIRMRENIVTDEQRRKKLETSPEDGEKECPICFENKMCLLVYQCNHSFCKGCLQNWSKVCPICRSS